MSSQFVVKHSPFIHSGNDINKMFLYLSATLMVPAVFGVLFFGLRALVLILVSLLTCFLSELLFNFIDKKKFYVDNLSFFVTGLILALTMPYQVSFYVLVASAFFSIFVVKQIFGGLGFNKFNPANTGRCFAGVIVPAFSSQLYEFTLNEELYTSFTAGGTNTMTNLISGQAIGGIGTSCSILILVCALILAIFKVIDIKIPIIAILSYFITALIGVGFENASMNILSGSFLFVTVFMITDPNTSPDGFLSKVIYSILFGVLSALLWQNGRLGENTVFVVALLVNVLSPIFDKYLTLKPMIQGGYRNARKK